MSIFAGVRSGAANAMLGLFGADSIPWLSLTKPPWYWLVIVTARHEASGTRYALPLSPMRKASDKVWRMALAMALPAPAQTPSEPAVTGDVPMADYLALLQQISPAAHQGAQAYLQAHERRCRRSLSSRELRQAMAEGDGDPLLMAMIRASHVQDGPGLIQIGRAHV